jgi:hypothetical protein
VEPCALLDQVDGDRILEILLSNVFPNRASHAPHVLEPVAHVLVRHRITGKTGYSAGNLKHITEIFEFFGSDLIIPYLISLKT